MQKRKSKPPRFRCRQRESDLTLMNELVLERRGVVTMHGHPLFRTNVREIDDIVRCITYSQVLGFSLCFSHVTATHPGHLEYRVSIWFSSCG